MGLLSDSGRPVMLVGENGCGKSAIVSERVRTVCSGEVAEVLSLQLQANRYLDSIHDCHTPCEAVFVRFTSSRDCVLWCVCIRFTSSRLLYDRLDEKLEWKHGKTFIPRGNKKLLCFIDDINLAQVRMRRG